MKATDFKQFARVADISQVAQMISQDVKDYLVIAEQEQTKRALIKSDSKIELARIEAIRKHSKSFLIARLMSEGATLRISLFW